MIMFWQKEEWAMIIILIEAFLFGMLIPLVINLLK